MKTMVDQVFLKNDTWLGVGGNTPWAIDGTIKEIELMEPDPRNFNGADSVYIFIRFDSGYTLKIKTNDYMVVYQESV